MSFDQDAVDAAIKALRPELDDMKARISALEAGGQKNRADEAWLDLNAELTSQVNATESDEERAAIIERAIAALRS